MFLYKSKRNSNFPDLSFVFSFCSAIRVSPKSSSLGCCGAPKCVYAWLDDISLRPLRLARNAALIQTVGIAALTRALYLLHR
jgi:hypothetical protein